MRRASSRSSSSLATRLSASLRADSSAVASTSFCRSCATIAAVSASSFRAAAAAAAAAATPSAATLSAATPSAATPSAAALRGAASAALDIIASTCARASAASALASDS